VSWILLRLKKSFITSCLHNLRSMTTLLSSLTPLKG
jgi:hypothetical protein